jgi:hypothetical protein
VEAVTGQLEGDFTVEWRVTGPAPLPDRSLIGTTVVSGGEIQLPLDGGRQLEATLDTNSLAIGAWQVGIVLTQVYHHEPPVVAADGEEPPLGSSEIVNVNSRAQNRASHEAWSLPIEVRAKPFESGDDVAVTMKRTAVPATSDQALWVAIRSSTNALGFENYSRFLDRVMCGDGAKGLKDKVREVERRSGLPFPNVNRYRLLKAATEVFLMLHCGVDLERFNHLHLDLDAESRRLNRTVDRGDLEAQWRDYLNRIFTSDGEALEILPYLELIRIKLGDVPVIGGGRRHEDAEVCYGILAEKLSNPCFLELIWSYWLDEGSLMQTMNAITWRFQNRTHGPRGRDPLEGLEIDPLRPLNNLLWGWIQDAQHRLTTVRRAYEYDHHYGLVLASKPGPPVRGADSRSRFIEALHNLLRLCMEFNHDDDDTTRIADGFGVLNALKETHLLLTQGAHNAYGDLPWTARHEMLMNQWILARPEMRDFLPTRTMVAYPEAWMDRVEAMSKLQGWSDASVMHFRDMAVFGEQMLLGIRFGNWTSVIEPEQAANWARYWRAEVQGYIHAYRAVTGVDLAHRTDRSMPAVHLRRQYGALRG